MYLIRNKKNYLYDLAKEEGGSFIAQKLDSRWIQLFCNAYYIVSRSLKGKYSISISKKWMIEREVLYHLGQLARQFTYGTLS